MHETAANFLGLVCLSAKMMAHIRGAARVGLKEDGSTPFLGNSNSITISCPFPAASDQRRLTIWTSKIWFNNPLLASNHLTMASRPNPSPASCNSVRPELEFGASSSFTATSHPFLQPIITLLTVFTFVWNVSICPLRPAAFTTVIVSTLCYPPQ